MLTAVLAMFANIHIFKVRKKIISSCLYSYIQACCIWMLFLFSVTELLSIFHAVRFIALFAVWVTLDIILLVLLAVQIMGSGYKIREICSRYLKEWILLKQPYYGILFMIGAIVAVLALCMTPYNWDSMTYHLPRITHWVQNRSVGHFATSEIRQIASPVLAEFVNLNVFILSRGKDTLLNLLQAGSYITCACVVGAIAESLGCDKLFKFIAVLIYMTTPIAFAEGVTTQVDNFAAVWLLFYVYVLLDLVKQEKLEFTKNSTGMVCVLGLCVAWGYLTKPSVCIGMVVFAVWLLVRCIVRKDKVWDLACLVFCALPCVVLPLVPEIMRNFKTFHSYASKSVGAKQLVGTIHPAYLFINFLKNLTINLPISVINDSQDLFIKFPTKAAEILGVDLNAESISSGGSKYQVRHANTYGCDTAVNPIVVWLSIFCVIWAICMIRRTDWKCIANRYLIVSSISFCAFCLVLRWEPFGSRYMGAYFAVLCPMIASQIQLRTVQEKDRPFRHGIIGVVCFLCVMQAIGLTEYYYNMYAHEGADSRPYGYFVHIKGDCGYYIGLTDEIRAQGYESVGLYMTKADTYEYPIWAMLDKQRIEHINVENESAVYADSDFSPDCIVWLGWYPEEPVSINEKAYTQIKKIGEGFYLLSE